MYLCSRKNNRRKINITAVEKLAGQKREARQASCKPMANGPKSIHMR